MNKKTPRAAAAFMMATIGIALPLCLWAVMTDGLPWGDLPAFLLLTLLGGLAHLYPIRSAQTNQATYVVANTFLFAGVMLLSAGWLAVMAAAVWIPVTVRRYRDQKPDWLLIPAANAGQSLIWSVVSHAVLGEWAVSLTPTLADVAILILLISNFVFFQTLWVGLVLRLARGVSLRSIDLWNRNALISDGVILCLGAVVALLWRIHPGLLVLVTAPVVFAYNMMRGVQLIRLGEFDGKTGLYNSRRFEEQFERELTSAKILHRPLSLVFLDLDFLRDINNNYGHLAGDSVIQEVASRIRSSVRAQDFAARFGGEEFVLLLPGTEVIEGQWMAERVRLAVESSLIDIGDGQKISCTISGGVASFPAHGKSIAQLTTAADEALYLAKRLGRNRTCTADESEAKPATESVPEVKTSVESTVRDQDVTASVMPEQVQEASTPVPDERAASKSTFVQPPRTPQRVGQDGSVLLLFGAIILLVPFLPGEQGTPAQLLVTLSILGFAAEYWKVELLSNSRGHSSVSLGVAITVAAAATLGLYGAICVNLANFMAYVLQARRRQWATLGMNLAIMVASAVAGSLPFGLLDGRSGLLDGWSFGAVLVAGTLYFLVNGGLVSLLVSRKQGIPFAQLWRQHYAWMAPNFIFTAVCGGLMGSAYLYLGWKSLPVFVLPLLLMRYTYQTHIRRSREAYETAERGRRALEEAHRLQSRSMEQLIESVAMIIDARDASVYGHSYQVARYAVAIATEMGLSPDEVAGIRQAALLHDLGKVGIPEAILHKPGKLTPQEWEVMKTHTLIGERILLRIPALEETARLVGEHHERYNGKGYPYGRTGEQISLGARIITLADSLDSMLSDRPYSKGKPLPWAIEEIERCAGEHFDPAVVAAFRQVVAKQPAAFFINSSAGDETYDLMNVACALNG